MTVDTDLYADTHAHPCFSSLILELALKNKREGSILLHLWWCCLVQVLQGTAVWDIELWGTSIWDIEVWGTAGWDIEVWDTAGWDIEVWGTAVSDIEVWSTVGWDIELWSTAGPGQHIYMYLYKIDYKFFTFTKIHNSHNTAEHITI